MRVLDKTKTTELLEYDLTKGYLREEKLFVTHHEAVAASPERWHHELERVFENGGRSFKRVVDAPAVQARDAWDEYEDIQVYVPYTEQELAQIAKAKYEQRVEQLLRERYSLNAELAILRQRDAKPTEFAAYNEYAEQCKEAAKQELGLE